MSDLDLDGIAEALPEGCLVDLLVNAWDIFPVPTTLGVASAIAHSQMNESAPIFHSLQDMTVYYGGVALIYAGHRMMRTKDTPRNRLLTAFAGAALFATSFFAMPNYYEQAFGGNDKPKTEQKAPTPKLDSASYKPSGW